jgi:hypothetical protein
MDKPGSAHFFRGLDVKVEQGSHHWNPLRQPDRPSVRETGLGPSTTMQDDHSWTFRNFSPNFCSRMKSSSTGARTRTSPVLLYRLNVFPFEMPPLRERKDDILILVEHFVQRYATRAGRNI